jgi:hypothetical protein
MMDFRVEDLLPLSQAARLWPGGSVHVATLHRYRVDGLRGIHLECVKNGGHWRTSWQAIDRFIRRLNSQFVEAPPTEGASKSAGLILAEKELDRVGI